MAELCDAPGSVRGLDPAPIELDAPTGVGAFKSAARFAGVLAGGAGPVRFWKKPAMLCCLAFPVLEAVLVLFFRLGGGRGVDASFWPPRAIATDEKWR